MGVGLGLDNLKEHHGRTHAEDRLAGTRQPRADGRGSLVVGTRRNRDGGNGEAFGNRWGEHSDRFAHVQDAGQEILRDQCAFHGGGPPAILHERIQATHPGESATHGGLSGQAPGKVSVGEEEPTSMLETGGSFLRQRTQLA